MKRIDEQTREEILELAEELEDGGWVVNRRAMAREFGVSPQTVARVLDGPRARRGAASPDFNGGGGVLLGLAAVGGIVWLLYKLARGQGQWSSSGQRLLGDLPSLASPRDKAERQTAGDPPCLQSRREHPSGRIRVST